MRKTGHDRVVRHFLVRRTHLVASFDPLHCNEKLLLLPKVLDLDDIANAERRRATVESLWRIRGVGLALFYALVHLHEDVVHSLDPFRFAGEVSGADHMEADRVDVLANRRGYEMLGVLRKFPPDHSNHSSLWRVIFLLAADHDGVGIWFDHNAPNYLGDRGSTHGR
jgi:hypothetical protein